jgi:hypothetical protein
MSRLFFIIIVALLSEPVLSGGTDAKVVLDGLNISTKQIEALESGEVVVMDGSPYEQTARELVADAAILVDSDFADIVSHFESDASFIPVDAMLLHAEIDGVEDFDAVGFSASEYEEVERLLKAKPGKDFNFSADEHRLIATRLRPLRRAGKEEQIRAASEVVREILIGRYRAYLDGGLDGIAPYQRSSRKSVTIAEDLRLTTATFEPFSEDFPGIYDAMTGKPGEHDCCEDTFRWMKVRVAKRPVFTLAHTVYQVTDDYLIATERFYYGSSQINGVQITLAWLRYDEDTYMGLSVSANADIVASPLGRMLRSVARSYAAEYAEDALIEARTELRAAGAVEE